MFNSQYLEKLSNRIETMIVCKETKGYNENMVNTELQNITSPRDILTVTNEEVQDTNDGSKGNHTVAAFITRLDIDRFGSIIETIENNYLKGDREYYPIYLNEIYKLLLNCKIDPKNISKPLEDGTQEGVSFLQNEKEYSPRQITSKRNPSIRY